jgi:hypothetical protein
MNLKNGIDRTGTVRGPASLVIVYLTLPIIRIAVEAVLQVLMTGSRHDSNFSAMLGSLFVSMVLYAPAAYWLTRKKTRYFYWAYAFLSVDCLLSLTSSALMRNLSVSMGLQIILVSVLSALSLIGVIRWQASSS